MLNVSIVIPAWNEEERINDCLLNATRQTVMPHEVIVVDNHFMGHHGLPSGIQQADRDAP